MNSSILLLLLLLLLLVLKIDSLLLVFDAAVTVSAVYTFIVTYEIDTSRHTRIRIYQALYWQQQNHLMMYTSFESMSMHKIHCLIVDVSLVDDCARVFSIYCRIAACVQHCEHTQISFSLDIYIQCILYMYLTVCVYLMLSEQLNCTQSRFYLCLSARMYVWVCLFVCICTVRSVKYSQLFLLYWCSNHRA